MDFENLVRVLDDYARDLKELYQYNLNYDNAFANGELINSVRYLFEHNGSKYEISLQLADYWKYVEYGRRSGKFPPVDKILNWIRVKPVIPRPFNGKLPSEKQLAFLISRKIALEGTKPRNILALTLEELNEEYDDKISEALTLDLSDIADDMLRTIIITKH